MGSQKEDEQPDLLVLEEDWFLLYISTAVDLEQFPANSNDVEDKYYQRSNSYRITNNEYLNKLNVPPHPISPQDLPQS